MMTYDEVINRGKDLLAQKGLVETKANYNNTLIRPCLPGLGAAGNGLSFLRNREALSKYYIKNKLLGDNFSPNTNIELFGTKLTLPVFAAPMSGIKTNLRGIIEEKDFLTSILSGCRDVGTLGMCGDGFDITSNYIAPSLIKDVGGIGVCKPRIFSDLKERVESLKKANVLAVGIDIDGIAGMLLDTNQVTRKSVEELRKIRSLFSGPMFLKGLLSLEDAVIAHKAGFDAIVVSNHGGRAVDYGLGTADILMLISNKLKGKIKILVDGGVRNGYDVFIYLALGADAVLVGRTMLYSVIGGGREGVKIVLSKIASDLRKAMVFSGAKKLSDINFNHIGRYE